jgi:protein SCO1
MAIFGAAMLWSRVGSGLGATSWFGAPAPAPPLNGAALEPAVALPALTLARSDGDVFTTSDTRGRLSLFFFGYTHCPDVCPLTLSELSQMRRALGDDAGRVDMYFVTLDPARDTPERVQAYVTNFPGIVGLIGSDTQLASAQSTFNVVAERHDIGGGGYLIDHTAAIFLVNAESQIQLVYPYGTSPDEVADDLHRLAHALPPTPRLVDAWARPAEAGAASAVYLRIQNPSAQVDRLIGVSSATAAAEIHQSMMDGGMMRMRPAGALDVPAGGELRFEPGGLHVMLTDLQQPLLTGNEIALSFDFERAGTVQMRVPVRASDTTP